MVDKFLWAVIPACITFGPLFMTRIAGSSSPEHSSELVATGVVMLSVGLFGIFRVITKQQKTIRRLESKLREQA